MDNLKAVIESILFIYGGPILVSKISEVTGQGQSAVETALEELSKDYEGRGFVVIKKEDSYELGTSPAYSPYVEKLIKSEFGEELSKASLETLAIVAYRGPISRAKIEYIRGVNSSFILRNLLIRGLVERIEDPKDARVYLYKISFDFLHHLGISRIEELPKFEELNKEKIEILEEK